MSKQYLQPDFYHFSEDSIALVKYIKRTLGESYELNSIVDLCAGCGIIGIELIHYFPTINEIVFIEKQIAFQKFIEQNLSQLVEREILIKTLFQSFDQLELSKEYDLLLCNPPYFEIGKSRPSPDLNKRICRTFDIGEKELFLKTLMRLKNRVRLIYFLSPHQFEKNNKRIIHVEKVSSEVSIYQFK